MKFIQKQLVASEPYKMHTKEQWICNVFELETKGKVATVYGLTKQEVESAAMIFVKAWKILQTTNDILTGKYSDNA